MFRAYSKVISAMVDKGFDRSESWTPYELGSRIKGSFEEEDERSFSGLTDMFMEARFSDHDIDPGSVPKVRSLAKKLEGTIGREDFAVSIEEEGREEEGRARWRFKVDHEAELKHLLGEKGVN